MNCSGCGTPLAVGHKCDAGKNRLELIAPEFLLRLGGVLTHGAKKYAPWNWAAGMDWSRPYGAILRHLNAWWAGETNDPDSGLSHLGHAAAELMFLIVYESMGIGKDDRFRHAEKPSAGPVIRDLCRWCDGDTTRHSEWCRELDK